jgi:hypothetical protein
MQVASLFSVVLLIKLLKVCNFFGFVFKKMVYKTLLYLSLKPTRNQLTSKMAKAQVSEQKR